MMATAVTKKTPTREQLLAATLTAQKAYIQAAPGSGKTMVAAQRFGVLRFTGPATDTRAVVALSFTKAATRELRQRIIDIWGSAALSWPHRVITIDTLLCEILSHLLRTGLIRWPNALTELEVLDTWRLLATSSWGRRRPTLRLKGRDVHVGSETAPQGNYIRVADFTSHVRQGICTHDEVRDILIAALLDAELRQVISNRLSDTLRALIVDEIFDANPLDLQLVELASARGISTTIIGDPWQALYRFRGAGPELVPEIVTSQGFNVLPLTQSFRFKTQATQALADELRAGLPIGPLAGATTPPDVALAGSWDLLWSISNDVVPLSFGSPNGLPEAAAIVLLDRYVRGTFGDRAVFIADALTTLGIHNPNALDRLADPLGAVLSFLSQAAPGAVNEAWDELVTTIGLETTAAFPRRHAAQTARLVHLQRRIQGPDGVLIPGITVHQAKGREWDTVGVRLSGAEQRYLQAGLNSGVEAHRQVYVALTRARLATVAI